MNIDLHGMELKERALTANEVHPYPETYRARAGHGAIRRY